MQTMLIDGRLLPSGTPRRATVAVVGAGPAGITIATALAARGVGVALIDSGGRQQHAAGSDALRGSSIGLPFPLAQSRRRGFGGTSSLWQLRTGLRTRPLDEIDFGARDVREAAWPFPRATLNRHYDRVHEQLGLPNTYDTAGWHGAAHPHPLTWQGGPELAMFQFAPHDTFLERFDEVVATDGIDLYLHSTVASIDLSSDGGRVASLGVVTGGDNRFTIEADAFVLAAGTIENARILLSSPGRDGAGVGNEHDNVGRYFMEHPSIDCGVLDTGGSLDVDLFAETTDASGRKTQAMLWLGEEVIAREGLLNAAFWVFDTSTHYLSDGVSATRALSAAIDARSLRHAAREAPGVARGLADLAGYAISKLRRSPPDAVAVRMLSEQLPDRDSRVRLAEGRDRLGLRRVSIDWRVSATDLELIRRHRDVLAGLLAERGVARFRDPFEPEQVRPLMSNHHHLGTTRMHTDPRHGVVDEHCRVHSVRNLYATGSSVFPAGGYLNPTLTILALADRLAEHLGDECAAATITSRRADDATS